jgi:competence protein ComEC
MASYPHTGRSTIPAFRSAVFLVAGILAADRWSISPGASLLCLTISAALIAASRLAPVIRPIGGIGAVALICSAGALRLAADRVDAPVLPAAILRTPVTLFASVASPPSRHRGQTRCLVEASAVMLRDSIIPLKARLSLTVVQTTKDTSRFSIGYGMRLALRGEAEIPPPSRNPGEFDMRRYYDANGITGSFFVRGYDRVLVRDSTGGEVLMRKLVVPVRDAVERGIDSSVGGDEGEFLTGLLIGDRTGIPVEIQKDFAIAGVAHVLAVSGSNVAVVALIVLMAYDLLRLPRRFRPPLTAAALVVYMLLTGSQPPVVRATIMALVLLLGETLERGTNGYNLLGVSALVILGMDARQLFDVGFQLSFAAVLSLIHVVPRANRVIARIPVRSLPASAAVGVAKLCAVTLAATAGTIPLMANAFGTVSLIGLLANLVVVPATSLSVVVGVSGVAFGAAAAWIGDAFGAVNWLILRLTLEVTSFCAHVPYASIGVYGLSPPATIAYLGFAGMIVHWGEWPMVRRLGIVTLIGLNLMAVIPVDRALVKEPGHLRVNLIDVGQGDAILVEFPEGETLLIDGGPRNPKQDAGAQRVVPFLRRKGIGRLDAVIVTHADGDHVGGMESILAQIDVGRVIDNGDSSLSPLFTAYRSMQRQRRIASRTIASGDTLALSRHARVYMLSPPLTAAGNGSGHPRTANDGSIVVKIVFGKTSFVFTGDAPASAEGEMIGRFGAFLHADVLKLGHHGSATSTSEAFLAAVHPGNALISVGRHNAFRHPSPIVMRRLLDHRIAVDRTDETGAVMFDSDGTTISRFDWRSDGEGS